VAVGVAVVALAIAAAFANVALLSSTGEDRIGRLSPVAAVVAVGAAPASPAPVDHGARRPLHDEHADD
jgi:hypothetical protein